MVLKLEHTSESPGGFDEAKITAPALKVSDSVDLGHVPRI